MNLPACVCRDDRAFVLDIMQQLPEHIHAPVMREYEKRHAAKNNGRRWANTFIRELLTSDLVAEVKAGRALLDELELRSLAKIKSGSARRRIAEKTHGKPVLQDAKMAITAQSYAATAKIKAQSITEKITIASAEVPDQWKALASLVSAGRAVLDAGIKPRATAKTITGFVERAKCPKWWRSQLRRQNNQANDQCARDIGIVKKGEQDYCADATVSRRAAQKKRNRETMADTLLVCEDDGSIKSVLELSDAGVSNPVNRRHELMTRIKGLEEWARVNEQEADFWTITTPSQFHRFRMDGRRNAKWNRSTPAQAHKYLCGQWAKVRAELSKYGAKIYGMRVVEPHKDGCPHWHILLFGEAGDIEAARVVARRFALQMDGEEKGAEGARFTAVRIDPARGSATGYAAKYVAKNIDGEHLSGDLFQGAANTAARVDAWAACWRIRQFQFFGHARAPVTLWRALRRFREPFELDTAIEQLRKIVDQGCFGSYIYAQTMGSIKLILESPEGLNMYGEERAKVPVGCFCDSTQDYVNIEGKKWRLLAVQAGESGPWTRGNNCNQGHAKHEKVKIWNVSNHLSVSVGGPFSEYLPQRGYTCGASRQPSGAKTP